MTPEAVVLDVATAGLGSRALARALDGLIQGTAVFAILLVTGAFALGGGGGSGTTALVVDIVLLTLIIFGYPIVWEWLWRGRTPGKAALGLRVVTRQGAPIRFRHAAVRGLLGLVEVITLPVIGVLAMLVSSNEQRLGDLAAGTIVIRDRVSVRQSRPVVFWPPPGWERFVASLDVSGMTAGEYETVRAFLIRASEMVPGPRTDLAARLAGPLVVRLQQPVPPGAGPELWLVCVAAAYQQRHGAPQAWGPPPGPWGPPPGVWGPPPGPPPPPGPLGPPPGPPPPPGPAAPTGSGGFAPPG